MSPKFVASKKNELNFGVEIFILQGFKLQVGEKRA